MKVVINGDFGGFNLSDKAVERCIELGMKATTYNPAGNPTDDKAQFVLSRQKSVTREKGSSYHIIDKYGKSRNAFRSDPRVVQAVEELGPSADGFCADLKVIEIPFDNCEGWTITEYDGNESVEEIHRSWS